MEVVQAGLPVERALVLRFGTQLLAVLVQALDAASGFHRERDRAGAGRRREHCAEAAVDVAAAVVLADAFIGGDRVQRDVAQVPAQIGAAAVGLQFLVVGAVDGGALRVEAIHQLVGAGLEDVGAEQTRGAVQVAGVRVEQRTERVAALVQQLQAHGRVGIAFQIAAVAVFHPVVAALAQRGQTRRPMLAHGDAQAAFQGHGAVGAVGQAGVAVIGADGRLDRIELDHARRRVAAEQRALRAAQHFQAFQIEDREALEEGVFLHHVVVHQRHRLRGVGIEVGVAIAADIHAREHTAVGGFDIQARRLAGQHADVRAAGGDGIQEFRTQHAGGHRHVLGVFRAALHRDLDRVQTRNAVIAGRLLGRGVERKKGSDGNGERADLKRPAG